AENRRGPTGGAGRLVIKPYPCQSLTVTAGGPSGSPILAASKTVTWPAGSSKLKVDLRLQRGVLVRGRVVESGSNRPVPGARIQYRPQSGQNRHGDKGNL